MAIVGLGLIGGSIARAVAQRRDWPVSAWDPDAAALRSAARAGLVRPLPDARSAVEAADLVVLAAPPLANLDLVDALGPLVASRRVTLTDVSSTKVAILARAEAVAGLRFVGGHPLSGREQAGFGASSADLLAGRPWVFVAGRSARPGDLARVRALARGCGARPVRLDDPDLHDRAVALISHLPLVVSAALAETATTALDWSAARGLAAQGFASSTRLARGDPALGAGIVATNAGPLASELRRLVAVLEGWATELEALAPAAAGLDSPAAGEQVERLEQRLAAVRQRLLAELRLP